MPNKLIRERLITEIQTAVQKAAEAAAINHKGTAGTVREVLMRDLLRPILSPEIDLGTGFITDVEGNQSPEMDVLLFVRRLLPPLLYDAARNHGAFPLESVLYSIEVKTTLTATEIKDSIRKARAVGELHYDRRAPGGGLVQTVPVIPALFAFGTVP